MLKRLQTDQSLARYAGWFIPLKIETNGEEWHKWASRYRHEGNAIPIIYVVRSDGQQLYGKSGALPGPELPLMIEQVLREAGTIYSDQQLQLLKSTLDKAQKALAADDVAGAVRELGRLAPLGSVGELGSYAEVAVEADAFARKLIERGRTDLAAAKKKLDADATRLDGAVALAATRRLYLALPPLKDEILAAVTAARTKPEVRETWKHAEQLDRARELVQKSASRRQGLTSLRRLRDENPDTPAATLASTWLREYDPETADAPARPAKPAPASKAADGEAGPPPKEIRSWKSDGGHTIEAALVGYGQTEGTNAAYVVLETRAGKRITVPLARLSADSQAVAKDLVRRLRQAGEK